MATLPTTAKFWVALENGYRVYSAPTGAATYALWGLDEDGQATQILDFPAEYTRGIGYLGRIQNTALFWARADNTIVIYATDGTAAGSRLIFDKTFDYLPGLQLLSTSGDKFTFAAWGVGGEVKAYESDGTAAGTAETFSGILPVDGPPNALAIAFSIFWNTAFGGPFPDEVWTGVSNDWVGPVVIFLPPPPNWPYGGITGPVYPNWATGFLPLSGNDVAIDVPGLLNADVGASMRSLMIGASSILNVTSGLSVSHDIVIDGAMYVSGMVTTPGTITVRSGGLLSFDDPANEGETTYPEVNLAGATLEVDPGGRLEVTGWAGFGNVTLSPGSVLTNKGALVINGHVTLAAGSSLLQNGYMWVNDVLTINGILVIGAADSQDYIDSLGVFDGTGTIVLTPSSDAYGNGMSGISGGPSLIIGADLTVRGAGWVRHGLNNGTIIADQTQPLWLNGIWNNGNILATSGAQLNLVVVQNGDDGKIVVDGGTVDIGEMAGGSLVIRNGGKLHLTGTMWEHSTYYGVEISDVATDGTDITVDSTSSVVVTSGLGVLLPIRNLVLDGDVRVEAGSVARPSYFGALRASGSGVFHLAGNADQSDEWTYDVYGGGGTLSVGTIEAGLRIEGSGQLLAAENHGTITADRPETLLVTGWDGGFGPLLNFGTIQAVGGTLALSSVENRSDAAIVADDGTIVVRDLTGGSLSSLNGGILRTTSTSTARLVDVTIDSGATLLVPSGQSLGLSGTITVNGTLALELGQKTTTTMSPISKANLLVSGAGSVELAGTFSGLNSTTLDADLTVHGAGLVQALVNHGTIVADRADPLSINGVTNDGTLRATSGSMLSVAGGTNNGVVIADGGTVTVTGPMAGKGNVTVTNGGMLIVGSSIGADQTVNLVGDGTETILLNTASSQTATALRDLSYGDRIAFKGATIKSATVSPAGTITVSLANGSALQLTNATFASGVAKDLIVGHDMVPGTDFIQVQAQTPMLLSIASEDAAQLEGDGGGTTPYTFVVSRTGDTSEAASVNWSVAGNGVYAASGDDFEGGVLPSGNLAFAAGEVAKTITVNVVSDSVAEFDEGFTVSIGDAAGAGVGTAAASGVIQNDDGAPPPRLSISADLASLNEGDAGSTSFTFTVTRAGDSSDSSSAEWIVTGSGSNPATASDFVGGALPTGKVDFGTGETSKTLTVSVRGDYFGEYDEGFTVSLRNPSDTAIQVASANGIIRNDDSLAGNEPGAVLRVSTAADGTPGNGASSGAVFSPDGTRIAFYSAATNLVPGDSNGKRDVFIKDLATGIVVRASTAVDGTQSNGDSSYPVFSPDGKKIAFFSEASNLVPNDSNGISDLFIKDLETGVVTRVSGSGAYGPSVAFSPDGTKIAYTTGVGVTVKDLTSGTVMIASSAADGTVGQLSSYAPAFSPDGQKLAFFSAAPNLVPNDTNGMRDIFVKDLVTGEIVRVSTAADGSQGTHPSPTNLYPEPPIFTPDGLTVIFSTDANGLVSADKNTTYDVFAKNLETGAISLISTSANGAPLVGGYLNADLSAGGTRLLLWNTHQIYLKDLQTGTVAHISEDADRVWANSDSYEASFSSDGGRILLSSLSSNLVKDDANGYMDIFIKSLASTAYSVDIVNPGGFEDDGSGTAFTFQVSRSGLTSVASSVNWAVSGVGDAPASAEDFAASELPSGMVNFAADEISKIITIPVLADSEAEADEGFAVRLSNPGDGTDIVGGPATGTILDDDVVDPIAFLAVAPADAVKAEGNGGSTNFTFTVTRSGNVFSAASASWMAMGSGLRPADAADFSGGAFPSGLVTFAPLETTRTITVAVSGDTVVESHETFEVLLSDPSADTEIATASAEGTIAADDTIIDFVAVAGAVILDAVPQFFTGPVTGVEKQWISGDPANTNATAAGPNWFIHTGAGDDAIAVSSGRNVLDGGGGSNFLTGGTGPDTFFLDARAPSSPIWSTITNLGTGDDVTMWGINETEFSIDLVDDLGAPGFLGLTVRATANGAAPPPIASLTLSGYAKADLGTSGTLIQSFGFDPASNSHYLHIAHT